MKKIQKKENKGFNRLLLFYHPDKRMNKEPNKIDDQIYEYLQNTKEMLLNSFEKINNSQKHQLISRYNQNILNKSIKLSDTKQVVDTKPQQQDKHVAKLKELVNRNRERNSYRSFLS